MTPSDDRSARSLMHDGLEALAARVDAECFDRGTTDRDRLGGDCFIRIELERYLRATAAWLLPLANLSESERKKHLPKPLASYGAGALAHHISGPLRTERTRALDEVSLLFPALAREAIVGVVIQVLTDVMHGRPARLAPEQIQRLRELCAALLQRFGHRPWALERGQRVGDATVIAPLRRALGMEQYRVRRADGTATTLLVAAPDARAARTPTHGPTIAVEASGVVHDRRWVRCSEELLCTFDDVIAERHPGKQTAGWALSTLERLVTPMLDDRDRAPLSSELIVFARSNATLDRPMLLPSDLLAPRTATTTGVDPLGTTQLLSLAATGTVKPPSQWGEASADAALTRWAHQVTESASPVFKDPRTAYAAMHTLAWSAPVGFRSGLFGDSPAHGPTDRRWTRPALLVALVAVSAATLTAVLAARHTSEQRTTAPTAPTAPSARPRPVAPPPRADETPEQVLARWDESVRAPTEGAFAGTYVDGAYVHGFLSMRETEGRARSAWAARVLAGGWFRGGPRQKVVETEAQLRGYARRACGGSGDPSAQVLRFSSIAEWNSPNTHPAVPCPLLSGPYFWRMKHTPSGWRICHEGWELRSAICASCPRAPACAGIAPEDAP